MSPTPFDIQGYLLINALSSHPFLDWLMVLVSRPQTFMVPAIIAALIVAWHGDGRTRLAFVMILLSIAFADLMGGMLKDIVGRPRPYWLLDEAQRVAGGPSFRSRSGSFPSNHAANMMAFAITVSYYFRRWYVLVAAMSAALLTGLSRVYLGVHYPSDVVGGLLVGGLAAGALIALDRWAPPLVFCEAARPRVNWSTIAVLILAMVTFYRLGIVVKDYIPLAAEEAQYWAWSRQLDWSYYSKPGGIAWLIALGTAIFGQTELGIRIVPLGSSVLMGLMTWVLVRRMFGDGRLIATSLLMLNLLILYAIGAVVATTDAPLMLFWVAAVLAAWFALFEESKKGWVLLGVAIALGLCAKYAMIYLPICLYIYLTISPGHRRWLRTPWPHVATAIGLLGLVPVVWWNAAHDWVSFRHLAGQTTDGKGFTINPLSMLAYIGGQTGVVGPGLFAAMIASALSLIRREGRAMDPRLLFLVCFGVPVFLGLLLKSLQGQVLGNWAAPAYYTWTILACWWFLRLWDEASESPARRRWLAVWAGAAVALPIAALVLFYEPSAWRMLNGSVLQPAGIRLKPSAHPHYQFIGGPEAARLVDSVLGQMPRPERTFIITRRYQEAALLQFYCKGQPRTYNLNTGRRMNQFDIWGGLDRLEGWDAIYVIQGNGDDFVDNPLVLAGFQHLGPALRTTAKRGDQVIRTYTAYPAYGFRGSFPNPPGGTRRY
jgi:undecaprenyl-diphosphatase